jgi:hypothetical protein
MARPGIEPMSPRWVGELSSKELPVLEQRVNSYSEHLLLHLLFCFQIPAPDKEPLTVLDVQKIGYILHGRTIREEKPRKKLRAVLQIFIG